MNEEYTINADKARLDIDVIHRFLSEEAYWCLNIPRELVQRSIDNSVCFGVYQGDNQVGFARVVTDLATFGYLADVFILPEHRGKGLSKQLMAFIMAYPPLQGLRRIMLVTRDAHGLYKQFGFQVSDNPENTMYIKAFTSY
ncbi:MULTISPECIES: GNAT family N-acetyltransferase [unclassified Spirosoma]|uniref:GNAT family N-acetyltransferase n=1 Tax=unclassified Spirosoma TaxID=2621999 RepID=UPI0009592258|nr:MULTISPECIES: GNAT family N-acetyltransferase [unclassified Spirosoma]MBN8825073.1 GNAT family N-acetyltransferase [Spirosoma sp.]OJW73360.1 MAG: GNAT family N-acetyltransferase [Spirosoma sp. 48-14]